MGETGSNLQHDSRGISMAWHFKDSQGIKGPLTETQIRELLNSGNFDPSAMVRQGDSSWVAADTVRTKFDQLEKVGIYLRSDNKIFGPFVARRADELKSQNPDRFDSYKIGKNGKWLTVETPRRPESGTPDRSPPPPPNANTPKNPSPISAKEAFAPLVSLAKQTANRIASNPRVQEVVEKGKKQFQNKTANASSSPPAIPLPRPTEKKTITQKPRASKLLFFALVSSFMLVVCCCGGLSIFGLLLEQNANSRFEQHPDLTNNKSDGESSSVFDFFSSGRNKLSKAEFRNKLKEYKNAAGSKNIFRTGVQPNINDFYKSVGKPDRTQTLGEKGYWYWNCTDGIIQMSFYLQGPNFSMEPNKDGKLNIWIENINDY